MIETKVKYYGCANNNNINVMEIVKEGSKVLCILNSFCPDDTYYWIIVCKPDMFVNDDEMFISLIKRKHGSKVRREWHRIVGKLCAVETSSKYFDGIKLSDHCANGMCNVQVYSEVYTLIKTALDVVGYELPAIPSKE